MRRRATFVAALVLAAALAGTAAPARAAGATGSQPASGWSLSSLWAWLTGALPWPVVQSDCGSQIDPNGGCHTGAASTPPPVQVQSDCGSHMDPNGQCHS
jgi:hypothetical protein